MPHVDTEPTTHYPGCWRDPAHHACAVWLIEAAERIMRYDVENVRDAMGYDGLQSTCAHDCQWLTDAGYSY